MPIKARASGGHGFGIHFYAAPGLGQSALSLTHSLRRRSVWIRLFGRPNREGSRIKKRSTRLRTGRHLQSGQDPIRASPTGPSDHRAR